MSVLVDKNGLYIHVNSTEPAELMDEDVQKVIRMLMCLDKHKNIASNNYGNG